MLAEARSESSPLKFVLAFRPTHNKLIVSKSDDEIFKFALSSWILLPYLR